MGVNPPPDVEAPSPTVTDEQVDSALQISQRVRDEAEPKIERAEVPASEVSGLLRRLSEAMDRNPRSWDDLFTGKRRE